MQHYTYAHVQSDSGCVFYIGKGQGGRAYATKGRSAHWLNVVMRHGFEAVILGWWPTAADAFAHERELIALYRALGAPLVNMTDGGEGLTNPSQTTRDRLARAAREQAVVQRGERSARVISAWQDEALRERMTRASAEARRTDAFREQASALRKGKPMHGDEVRAKCSAASKAFWADPVNRERQVERFRAANARPSEKARRSAASLAMWSDPEQRAKLSAMRKAEWARRKSSMVAASEQGHG